MLLALILIPLIGAALIALSPSHNGAPRNFAMLTTLVAFMICVWTFQLFNWHDAGAMQLGLSAEWLPAFGLSFSLGVDSVSLLLVGLTALLGPICVMCSFTAITERTKTYYAWLMVLQAAMTGVFCAQDLIVFYVCFEFTLIPMWVLIHLFGSSNRHHAATKFFLYTFTGSLITLAGLIYVVWFTAQQTGAWTFDIATLATYAPHMSLTEQSWVMLAMMLGFAVKVPLFPLHTWLPLAHTEAPTAGSVILAGVLLKLGTYGMYRFVLPFVPAAVVEHATLVAVLAIIGILYAGLICWVQRDVKKLVAYSSVSHLGFCVLGMFALNTAGLSGSVAYMINHGLSTGALFLMIGMIYERYHTRSMDELKGLATKMPVWSSFMVFFVMASVGLPGLNGFIGEFLCIFGTFQSGAWGNLPGASGMTYGPWFAFFAGLGMIVAAIYLLYMTGSVVFGELVEPEGHQPGPLPTDLNVREIVTLLPLAFLCLALGVYPKPLLSALEAPVNEVAALVEHGAALAGVEPVYDTALSETIVTEEAPR